MGFRLKSMRTVSRQFAAACLICTIPGAYADMIPMRDFNLLSRGMSEAEVLFRVGPYDHETRYTDYDHSVVRKIWYYIPARATSNAWITEIEFDQNGVVQSLNRYRARR
jgi:hypothetical protein